MARQKSDFLDRLANGKILVADGAMGTMLQAAGLQPGECPEAFGFEHPDTLTGIAAGYLNAGSDIIQTNTFGGSPLKLEHYGLSEKAVEINRSAVEAVRTAVNNQALVSGSCGPCGKILAPFGDTDPEAAADSFSTQIEALVGAGVDIICVETMTDLTEAMLAIKAARKINTEIPIMATMTFDQTPRGYFTMMGVSIEQAAKDLADAGADVVGSNCGNGWAQMVEIIREFRQHTDLPLLVQANAGLPEIQGGQIIYTETASDLAGAVPAFIEAGANIIGGCCGTTPEYIAAVREVIDRTA